MEVILPNTSLLLNTLLTKKIDILAPLLANQQNCSHNRAAKHIKISCLPRDSLLKHSWPSRILPQVIRDIHFSPRLLCSWFLVERDYRSKSIDISTCIHKHPGMPGYKNTIDCACLQSYNRQIGNCLARARQQLKVELTVAHGSLIEGFPTVASCYWYGSRTNNRKLGKLYMVFKSTKCCLHFTSAFDWQKNPCGFVTS